MPKILAITFAILGSSIVAQSAVLTVGPNGTYGTIQLAINVAASSGGDTEIRVEKGNSYFEDLLVPASFSTGRTELTGGWNDTFSLRDPNPDDTVIDGFSIDRPLEIRLTGGQFLVDGFTVKKGVAAEGGGILVWPGGDSLVTIRNIRLIGNLATDAGQANGGGLYALLDGAEKLIVDECRIRDNRALSTGGNHARGGGMFVYSAGQSVVQILNTEIDSNAIESSGGVLQGGGIYLKAVDESEVEIRSTHPYQNSADGPNIYASGAAFETTGSASLAIEACGIALNTTRGSSAPQIRTVQTNNSSLTIRDSGVAWSDGPGLSAFAYDSSRIHLVNLTVADNATTGLFLSQNDSSTFTLYNSIAFNNGSEVGDTGVVEMAFNLIGVDPKCVDPDQVDYRLRPGSPAENAGTNTPPGGLGSVDFDGEPRIEDGTVDIGMYEGITFEIFSDGFETGDASVWSSISP